MGCVSSAVVCLCGKCCDIVVFLSVKEYISIDIILCATTSLKLLMKRS